MHDSIEYSVVVACFESGVWLEELVDRISGVLNSVGRPFEIILVNDASGDDTWAVIQRCAQRYPQVHGIDLLFNTGQFLATICGLEHSRGKKIILMDDDLQHPPEEIPVLIEGIEKRPDLDCVMGAYAHKRHSPLRRLGSSLMARLNKWLHGQPHRLRMTSFYIMRREVAEAIQSHRTSMPILGPILLKSTKRIANVIVEHHPRRHGVSGYRISRLVRITLDNIISSTTLPLTLVALVGLFSSMGSVGLGIAYFIGWILGGVSQPGFISLVLLICFFGGMTLLSLGMIGEYLIRIIRETANSPRYSIRRHAGSEGLRVEG